CLDGGQERLAGHVRAMPSGNEPRVNETASSFDRSIIIATREATQQSCCAMAIRVRSFLVCLLLLLAHHAGAQALDDPHLACDRAAVRAEQAWHLPGGLLAAIGTVESGRPDVSGMHRRAWPWSINAEGWSNFASNKTDA